jgi:zinc transporter ZupT
LSTEFLQLLLLGIFAALANVLGGLILLPSKLHARFRGYLRYLVALGAGFMLAVTFIELLPEVFEIWQNKAPAGSHDVFIFPMVLFLGGYLLTQFFEHTIAPHFHLGEEVHSDAVISSTSTYTALGGFLIHTFFDGVSIAAAAKVNFSTGIMVFFAVFLHKFPEGFTIASLVLAAGKSWKQAFIAVCLVGAMTLVGLLSFILFGGALGITVAYALPVATGVTLYVAASDLIPEVNHHGGRRPLVSICVFAGVAIFFLLHYLLHILLEI